MQIKFHLKNLADIYAAEIRVYDTLNSDDKSNPTILTSAWAPESWILVRDINHKFEGAIVVEVAGMRWAWIENAGETGRWYASSKEDNFSSYCSVYHKESSDGSAQYEKPQELTFLKINPFKVIIKDTISYDSKDFQINYIFNPFGVLWQAEDWGVINNECSALPGEEVSGSVEELKNYKIIQWGD